MMHCQKHRECKENAHYYIRRKQPGIAYVVSAERRTITAMQKTRLKRIMVTDLYPPHKYSELKTGDTVISMEEGKLWRIIDKTEGTVTIIPYSGGMAYDVPADNSKMVFGKINIPEEVKALIALG